MPDKSGVEIYKRFYPWPERFRLGDPVLVREVTGMSWPEFVGALQAMEDDQAPDPIVEAGLIAVAFWQGNPQMSRDKVRRAVEKIHQDDVEVIDGDEGDADPPAQAAGETPSSTTSESPASQDSISEATNPSGFGSPGSPNPHPESLPA